MKQYLGTQLIIATFLIVSLALSACSSGDSDSDDAHQQVPLTNACSVLGLNPKIINGTACNETKSPVVRINIVGSNNLQGLCSGVMLTKKAVLTAAHCFIEDSIKSVNINANGVKYDVSEVVVHPELDILFEDDEPRIINDVAILKLSRETNLPSLPILATQPLESGDIFSIFGFGLDESGNLNSLRSGQSKINSLTDQHIIANFDGVTGSNSCNGDSGGPAIRTIGAQSAIVGLVSSGSKETCDAGDTSLYANITSGIMLNFIKQEVPDVGLL